MKKRRVRELYPNNSPGFQSPTIAHSGIEDSIAWPSGATQEFEQIFATQQISIREESDEIQVVVPGRLSSP